MSIPLGEKTNLKFNQVFDYVQDWCNQHKWVVGVGEIAIGAAILASGIQSGLINLGGDLVGTTLDNLDNFNSSSVYGAASGGAAGALAASILGSIGIAGLGTGIGVPASLLILGGAGVFAMFGYTAGDVIHNFLNPQLDIKEFFAGTSLTLIGVALIVDGARRIFADRNNVVTDFKNGTLYLARLTVGIIAKSLDDLRSIMDHLAPKDTVDAVGSSAGSIIGVTAGAAIGGSIGASTVTILGSQTLGGAALSLGLVSAPIWPIIATGVAGLAVGFGAWRTIQFFGRKK